MSACLKQISSIISIFDEDVTVKRGGTPVIDPVTGRLTQPITPGITEVIKAAIYPATERDARLLPEGSRARASIVLFSKIKLDSNDAKLNARSISKPYPVDFRVVHIARLLKAIDKRKACQCVQDLMLLTYV